MATAIRAYRTDDGKLFATQEEAERYEEIQRAAPLIERLVRYQREYRWALRHRRTNLARWFLEGRSGFIRGVEGLRAVEDAAIEIRERMKSTLRIIVMGRREAEAYRFSFPMLVLSIVDPHRLSPDADIKPGYTRIERFRFHDLDPKQHEDEAGEPLPRDLIRQCMTADDADRVVSAVEGWLDEKGEEILVHCDAGISRSAGVAAALSWLYNGDDSHWHKTKLLNAHVKRQVIDAWTRRGPSILTETP